MLPALCIGELGEASGWWRDVRQTQEGTGWEAERAFSRSALPETHSHSDLRVRQRIPQGLQLIDLSQNVITCNPNNPNKSNKHSLYLMD